MTASVVNHILVALLMIDSMLIAAGVYQKRNMWPYICVYWVLMAVKDVVAFVFPF